MGTVTVKQTKIEFDRAGISYITWYHYPDNVDHVFLRLSDWQEDVGCREVCVKIKKSELVKIRDAIDKTLGERNELNDT